MALYLISYDISEKDSFEYGPLWQRLRDIGATKILYSEWIIIDAVSKSRSIYDQIAPLTQKKDRLLVQEITKDATWDSLLIPDSEFDEFLAHARG
jgi:hypothetical protein